DSYSIGEDTALTVAAPGVLGNDTDVDGNSLTAVLVSGPSHGTLTLDANGSLSFTPAVNYNGPDSFTYKANNGRADSNVATVYINVISTSSAHLVAAYGLNEGSLWTASDGSGHSNHGTVRDHTWTSAGKFGAALSFDGVE